MATWVTWKLWHCDTSNTKKQVANCTEQTKGHERWGCNSLFRPSNWLRTRWLSMPICSEFILLQSMFNALIPLLIRFQNLGLSFHLDFFSATFVSRSKYFVGRVLFWRSIFFLSVAAASEEDRLSVFSCAQLQLLVEPRKVRLVFSSSLDIPLLAGDFSIFQQFHQPGLSLSSKNFQVQICEKKITETIIKKKEEQLTFILDRP